MLKPLVLNFVERWSETLLGNLLMAHNPPHTEFYGQLSGLLVSEAHGFPQRLKLL